MPRSQRAAPLARSSFDSKGITLRPMILAAILAALGASSQPPIKLVVDASQAPTQNVVRTHEVIPVSPGKLTLYYPQWIPGEHAAVGPIQNVSALRIEGGGTSIPWHRDPL